MKTSSLDEILSAVQPLRSTAARACAAHLNAVAKPLGSLGKLETLLIQLAGITGQAQPDIAKKCVLVFCADNGVLAQGVAQSDHTVTTAIARSLAAGTASVSVMAAACGAAVFPVDVGMIDTVPGLALHKLARGTGDISRGPAMTRTQAEDAIRCGMHLVEEKKRAGYRLIAVGEAGIGNTTTASAVTACLLQVPPEQVTGRGSGLTDQALAHKKAIIQRALAQNRPNPADPLDVLTKVGGFDLAAMAGAFLGGALHRIPMIIDGFLSAAAALCAVRLCPHAGAYLLSSHVPAEPAGRPLLTALNLSPLLHGDFRLGEGTGAVTLFPLLDLAAAVYQNAATFADLQVSPYQSLSGPSEGQAHSSTAERGKKGNLVEG